MTVTSLPITHLTLYKHGVGFFERRAHLDAAEVSLTFRVDEMNDILKSLTAVDWGGGQVLGVEYATPQTREERLEGCSVQLADGRSLQDLLASLRGRRVRLMLDQAEALTGTLVGMDSAPDEQPLATALVSVLLDESNWVQAVQLGRVQGVELLDERGASDLRFFLQTSLTQENYRQVLVRLTPGQHDLSVSYIAPAPTWRVSYRLVVEEETQAEGEPQPQPGRRALLLGWGIFDNRLEEDLAEISLALVAGMPISFVYDLYTPFTPERPEVEEEARVAAAPVEFGQAVRGKAMAMEEAAAFGAPEGGVRALRAAAPATLSVRADALAAATPVTATGQDLGELFQYVIGTPVTVGRGQSAMVPVVSSRLSCRKDLLYNGSKLPAHPVATLRLKNETGLTLERGPLTVLENGDYVGEALLPFTAAGGELVVPYAVELGATVNEAAGTQRELRGLRIEGHYLAVEEWMIYTREYRINNTTARPLAVLVEHPRLADRELFDTPAPKEQTDQHLRFEIETPAYGEATLNVQERTLITRREELRKQSAATLQRYLKLGLLSSGTYKQANELIDLWSEIAGHEKRLVEIEQERQRVYKAQEQIQGNMKALSTTGKEGDLRAGYVDNLRASEEQLKALAQEEARTKETIQRLNQEVAAKLKALG